MSNVPLVTVARYGSAGEAQLAKAQLEGEGIACVLANGEQSGLGMMFDAGRSGVQVKVAADRADEAHAVLDADP